MSAELLKEACDAILADQSLQPVKDAAGNILETHCNFGAERVAAALGCIELNGLMADQQYAVMKENATGRWTQVNGSQATQHALAGALVFAAASSAMLHEKHGHIAACYPAPAEFSGSLDRFVPILANIGKEDHVEKESMAFPVADGEPDYFLFI